MCCLLFGSIARFTVVCSCSEELLSVACFLALQPTLLLTLRLILVLCDERKEMESTKKSVDWLFISNLNPKVIVHWFSLDRRSTPHSVSSDPFFRLEKKISLYNLLYL